MIQSSFNVQTKKAKQLQDILIMSGCRFIIFNPDMQYKTFRVTIEGDSDSICLFDIHWTRLNKPIKETVKTHKWYSLFYVRKLLRIIKLPIHNT
jgi:hypothetical protein